MDGKYCLAQRYSTQSKHFMGGDDPRRGEKASTTAGERRCKYRLDPAICRRPAPAFRKSVPTQCSASCTAFFRRTLGEKCIITEKTLRSFCRAVGPRTPVGRIRLKPVAKFLAGTGPITRTWHFKYAALKGLFRALNQSINAGAFRRKRATAEEWYVLKVQVRPDDRRLRDFQGCGRRPGRRRQERRLKSRSLSVAAPRRGQREREHEKGE